MVLLKMRFVMQGTWEMSLPGLMVPKNKHPLSAAERCGLRKKTLDEELLLVFMLCGVGLL